MASEANERQHPRFPFSKLRRQLPFDRNPLMGQRFWTFLLWSQRERSNFFAADVMPAHTWYYPDNMNMIRNVRFREESARRPCRVPYSNPELLHSPSCRPCSRQYQSCAPGSGLLPSLLPIALWPARPENPRVKTSLSCVALPYRGSDFGAETLRHCHCSTNHAGIIIGLLCSIITRDYDIFAQPPMP